MTDVHFIINPIAGKGKHNFSKGFLETYFDVNLYTLTVKLSNYKGHAIALTNESIIQKATIIVACGGDGTINEVASTLVDTKIPLAIIPVGSGNGLASNLNISRNVKKAITVIKNNQQTKIDVGCINNSYFFSNIGFGFDANVIKNYEASENRTLYCYVKAALQSFVSFNKNKAIDININANETLQNPFIIFVSNSNEMGYNISLTPKASLQDGLLDVVIVPKLNTFKMIVFALFMLIKKPQLLKEAHCFQTKKMTLNRTKGECFESQIDGEFFKIENISVSISLKEKALVVIY